jgi:hypothetical protein
VWHTRFHQPQTLVLVLALCNCLPLRPARTHTHAQAPRSALRRRLWSTPRSGCRCVAVSGHHSTCVLHTARLLCDAVLLFLCCSYRRPPRLPTLTPTLGSCLAFCPRAQYRHVMCAVVGGDPCHCVWLKQHLAYNTLSLLEQPFLLATGFCISFLV